MVKRLRRRPLTAKTGVRVPVGLPKKRAQVKPVHAFLVLPARKANHARTKSRAEPHLPCRASVRVRAQREPCADMRAGRYTNSCGWAPKYGHSRYGERRCGCNRRWNKQGSIIGNQVRIQACRRRRFCERCSKVFQDYPRPGRRRPDDCGNANAQHSRRI